MSNEERVSGHGNGDVTIGPITVRGRWRFSHAAEGSEPLRDFRFVITLTVADRRKLVNLKKGDAAELTAGPFQSLFVNLHDLDYDDGGRRVSLTFITNPVPQN